MSTAGGVTVLVAFTGLTGGAVFAASPDLGTALVWVVGWGAVIRAARKVPGTPDPAPPPPPERGSEENTQVRIVRDTTHPNRWTVTRESPWMTYEHETGTEK